MPLRKEYITRCQKFQTRKDGKQTERIIKNESIFTASLNAPTSVNYWLLSCCWAYPDLRHLQQQRQRGYPAWIVKKKRGKKAYTTAKERFAQKWVKTWKLVLWAQNSGPVVTRGCAGFNRERICFQICTLLPHLHSKTLSPFTTTQDSHLSTLNCICCKEGINFAAICTWFESLQSFW